MNPTLDPMRALSALAICGSGAFASLATWVINNRDRVADMPLGEIAAASKVSETTVFRFARQLGFSGYREMRVALAELRGIAHGQKLSEEWMSASHNDPYSAIINNTINVHSEILRNTAVLTDPIALRSAVTFIQNARVINVFGFGSSTGPVVDLYQRLIRFGYVASNYSDPHVLTAVTANPPAGSLFFGISFSGQSKDVVDVLASANRQGLPSVLITSHPDSAAAQLANVVLHSAPAGAVGGSETVGTRISQLTMIEMICTGLALEHPRKNEFLRNAAVIEREIEKKRVAEKLPTPTENLHRIR
ncbi:MULTISPECIES: MurR/RpiR family transcriptional regulator [Hyphomicrobiales]|uniref:Transcriptional regulator, RpiR family n=1 Tax=Bauldia litoralis TaxID=665467 RepID=A0A1G6EA17_9HYPH|nr:MurR/RpiR family transcriptional regulator [Bauldia litoralis]SDB54233.1 transcriptional regulator, RpiR family [Bauldia litoralis]